MKTEQVAERFWRYVEPEPNSGCWLWVGTHSTKGYGLMWVDGTDRNKKAHSVAYRLYRGQPPHGLQADHLCRVRSCVNPWHLEYVTPRENVLRGLGHTALNASKTACVRGHLFTPENTILENGGAHRVCVACQQDKWSRYRLYLKSQAPLRMAAITVGQVWESKHQRDFGRRVRIVGVNNLDAQCLSLSGDRPPTKLSVTTLRAKWRLIAPQPPRPR